MITKRHIVDTGYRKMSMGRGETLTGFSGNEMSDALDELEDMMAEWEDVNGWMLDYQFAKPTDSESDVRPNPNADSMINRRWLSAVASNLAVRLCSFYEIQPSSQLAAEAYNGTLALNIAFTKVPDKSSSYADSAYGFLGSGNLVRKW